MKIQNQIYTYALGLLGRREYSDVQLQKKLLFRFPREREAIAQVILALKEEGTLNNQRYMDSYVYRRASRGIGPLRILQELRELKPTLSQLNEAAKKFGLDWNVLANEVVAKRIRSNACKKAFLRYRGFTSEQVERAVGALTTD